jgi:UDP-N-acetylglucosamine 2-epimerase (non-hydrolysing)
VRVLTIVGTRPEVIKLSRTIANLDVVTEHTLVHTGQNTHKQLSDVFFDELQISKPDVYLNVDTSSLGAMLGDSFAKIEQVLIDKRPDAVLVLGDTNSGLSSFVAKRMHIPVFHMEAGNRSFDANVPEETNRKVIDHFADINMVYTEHARQNLLREGLHPQRIYKTGSPMREVLDFYSLLVPSVNVLPRNGFFLLSIHREENVDNPERLRVLMAAVDSLASSYDVPVYCSTHPRTRKHLDEGATTNIRFMEPFGFLEYLALQMRAKCVISDSGTISEESAMLGFPAVTPRLSMERPEAMDAGSVILAGVTEQSIRGAVRTAIDIHDRCVKTPTPDGYDVPNCSQRVVNLVTSLAGIIPTWDGLQCPR